MSQPSTTVINQQSERSSTTPESSPAKQASNSVPQSPSTTAAPSKRSSISLQDPHDPTSLQDPHEDDNKPGSESSDSKDIEDHIKMDIFQQILELDDDDDGDFSKNMVHGYFDQADNTFTEMDAALLGKKLTELSNLGHFLKGSAAALGIWRVQASCESIQHYGQCWDEQAKKTLSNDEALEKITRLLPQVKKDNVAANESLMKILNDRPTSEPTPEATA